MASRSVASPALTGRLDEDRFEDFDLRSLLSVLSVATAIESQGDTVLRQERAGLRLKEFDILAFVYAAGSIRPSELLNRASMSASAPTVHAILGRLQERGLVDRSPHPDDARGVLISITDEGKEAIDRFFPAIERKVINRFAGHFSAEELMTLASLLERARPPR